MPEVTRDIKDGLLSPGEKLVVADLTFFEHFARIPQKIMWKEPVPSNEFEPITREYKAIKALLTTLAPEGRVLISQVSMRLANNTLSAVTPYIGIGTRNSVEEGVVLPFLNEPGRQWPRDSFINIGGVVHANPERWLVKSPSLVYSKLGVGGAVQPFAGGVLVSEIIKDSIRREARNLERRGVKVDYLPVVNPFKQNFKGFSKGHTDGHGHMLEQEGESKKLVAARSYLDQDPTTRSIIGEIAHNQGAEIVDVSDNNLPPLALNMEQFRNGVVAMTSGAEDLERVVVEIMGRNKVFTTEVVLEKIPTYGGGGIRCLTNILPVFPDYFWRVGQKS